MSPIRQRIRIRFGKTGDLRLVSHRELVVVLERLFRRISLPLSMSEGFHPRPRMSFPSSLALGIEASDEMMEIELTEVPDADELLARLRAAAPPGLEFYRLELVPWGAPKPQIDTILYEFPVPDERIPALSECISRVYSQRTLTVRRDDRAAPLELFSTLDSLELAGGVLRLRLRVTGEASVRPAEVLVALGIDDLLDSDLFPGDRYWKRSEVALSASCRTDFPSVPRVSPDEATTALAPPPPNPFTPESYQPDETGDVDQRRAAGGMSDRNC
jgi:radical SAM-linked protein